MKPVYRFTKYDITTDAKKESRRWATREAIEKLGGETVEGTEIMIDEALLGREIEGMTDIGFDPNKTGGFQRQVR